MFLAIILFISCQYGKGFFDFAFDTLLNDYVIILGAGQDINLVRTEPDPQQLPCPQQKIKFQCQITVPSISMAWSLPTGDDLNFTGSANAGEVHNSSDNVYSATLTNKTDYDSRFLFTSTLLILEPANGSNITCSGGTGADAVAAVIISGE